MSTSLFHPLIAQWFAAKFGEPTDPQRLGWPLIAAGQNTLIAAPTGSGKTLSAFLVCLDRLFRRWLSGQLENRTYVVYVSPLKALSNDIRRNLDRPLEEISRLCEGVGLGSPAIRTLVRTGDTGAAERAKMLRQPPHILVTTPESLYILLTSAKARETLRRVDTVIVDEIHALARDKRGSHLSLSLERLAALCGRPPVRIGLSATQRPLEQIAEFLVGMGNPYAAIPQPLPPEAGEIPVEALAEGESAAAEPNGKKRRAKRQQPLFVPGPLTPYSLVPTPDSPLASDRVVATAASVMPAMANITQGKVTSELVAEGRCAIVDVGHLRNLHLEVEVPPSPLEAVCSAEQWGEIYEQLVAHIQAHRSTLIFVNTRRLAERVSHNLTEILGEEAVASHHGSLSRELRYDAEQRLKDGTLKAIVATASLEMGIDVGYIDLVVQLGSPRAIATFLQRVGRSGHSLGATPKGRLFPLTRDELMECLALMRAVRAGRLDQIEIPQEPVDILAQQIVATVASDDWEEDALFELVRRAYPFRNLERAEFDRVIGLLSEGLAPKAKRGAWLHRDAIHGRIRARRGARLAAITSGGAIPEKGEYRVVALPERTFVGTVDEDFAIESMKGDIFLLGNTSWRVQQIAASEVIVTDAEGAPPSIPFWFGESPGRTIELSEEVSALREKLADGDPSHQDSLVAWLRRECSASEPAATQAVRYVAAQFAAMGCVPTGKRIVFERFFDESGGMQLVVHAPLGSRINRAWGLAFRKRFCRSFDFELQASADDDGLVLSLGPQHSFPLESLFKMLNRGNGRQMLEQALLAVPMFQVRWRWNVTRALAVLRWEKGKKIQPFLQKFRSEDLLAACFPEQVGCLENHHGDVEIPNHPLVQQTLHDCLHEAMDIDRWLDVLDDAQQGKIEYLAIDTREPSPFSHELINAAPYAFLDGAPLEERRTRAVTLRRGLSADDFSDLARLDPDAIRQVANEAWPVVRDADEMHDTLLSLGALVEHEEPRWSPWLEQLVRSGRATRVVRQGAPSWWIAAEKQPMAGAVLTAAKSTGGASGSDCSGSFAFTPPVKLPEHLAVVPESAPALVDLIRGRCQHTGPITSTQLGELLGLEPTRVFSAFEALEGEGTVMRGYFTVAKSDAAEIEWCERRLLARIHRLTLGGLRRKIQPVEPADYLRYLTRHHRLGVTAQWHGPPGVREVLARLQGWEAPAGAWESWLLASRVASYDPAWLDELFLAGEMVWGRLRVPKREEEDGPSSAAMTRTAPISLAFREDLGWILPAERLVAKEAGDNAAQLFPKMRGGAQSVFEALQARGALFFPELAKLTGLLPTQLEDAVRELAAMGLITSDALAAVRAIVAGAKEQKRRERWRDAPRRASAGGRWSLFPGMIDAPPRADCLDRWCRLLLARYGVLFRDLLTRETAAPAWYELVPVLRRLERRGEIRGGRFVSGVAGEQYASEEAVQRLREVREDQGDEPWVLISAADPLNLVGILTPGQRVPATHKNVLALHRGKCVATRIAKEIAFVEEPPPELRTEIERALRWGPLRADGKHRRKRRDGDGSLDVA